MKGTTRFLFSMVASIAVIAFLTFLTYKIGGGLGKSLLASEFTQHQMKFQDWNAQYFTVVVVLGVITFLNQALWCVLTQFWFKITDMTGVAKRKAWLGTLIANAILCVVIPYVWSIAKASFLMTPVLTILFLAFFTLIGFWALSIFATPAAYKYTPIGAMKLRTTDQRK